MSAVDDATTIAHALGRAQRHGKHGWRCLCPSHADSQPSLDIDPRGDRLLFQCRAGCDNATILAALRSRGLWPPSDAKPSPNSQRASPAAVPEDKSRIQPTLAHAVWGAPTDVYRYTDKTGELVGVVCRWDNPSSGKSKEILPALPYDNRWRCWKAMPTPRPLYRLADLLARADAQVLVVEGERKCDDAAALLPDMVVVTWAGGAKAIHQTDWGPLAGRRVVLWPDNDQPGQDAMTRLAGLLAGVPATGGASENRSSIRMIPADPDRDKGWDIGDAIRVDGWDAAQVIEYARSRAVPYQPETKEVGEANKPALPGPDTTTPRRPASSAGGAATAPAANVVPLHKPERVADVIAFSDIHLAHEFARRHGGEMRYVAEWGKWFHWCGTHWQEEKTLLAFDMARAICQQAGEAADKSGKSIASAKTVAAVASLARHNRTIASTMDAWDIDRWLLNTPGGTVDLRTGELRSHRITDSITKITGATPDDTCETPIWDEFLDRVTCGDRAMASFIRRIFGYSLTGETKEHALFFFYGTGGNGKGTLINTLTQILGDYARVSPIETFTETKGDRHPTELAMLRGARMVSSQETEEGRRWAESRIKALTGGDPISARFMRQDFFTFSPEFKLIVAGNHKPGLRSVDAAIRRRFHLIPFVANIPAEERDMDLPDKLRAEWPGILSWAISGCIEWQSDGLRPPQSVTDATDEYLANEDKIAEWIDDACDVGATLSEYSSRIYSSFKKWAEDNGEYPLSQKRLVQKLEEKGYEKTRGSNGERMMRGLAVKLGTVS